MNGENRARIKISAQRARDNARKGVAVAGKKARESALVAGTMAKRLFRINLANTLTLFNGVSGFVSILFSMQGQFVVASWLILLGVLFDWFDGKAARAFDEVTPLGRELDSLSDLITFGVAPAVLVSAAVPGILTFMAAALFVLSAALRLGRFNVQKMKGMFFGVPTTANGVLLPVLLIFGAPYSIFPWYLFAMALLMNAPLRIKKVL